jgi:hypothetical protein
MLTQMMNQQEGVKPVEAEMEWGVGDKHRKARTEAVQARLEEEKERPFAVYADDVQRNAELRDVDRWGDPMLNFMLVRVGHRQFSEYGSI